MHGDADMSAETSDVDGRWLTYDQLAALRRIDKPSAVKLATRNRWRRRKSNAGQMQVCVPVHWFERAQDRADRYADKSVDIGADISLQAGALAALEDAVAALREARDSEIATLHGVIDGLRASIARAENRAGRAETDRDAERARADAAEADRRAAISLADQSVAMLTDAVVRADRAEAAIAGERSRVDAIRDRLDDVGSRLADAQAELAAAQDQAEAATARAITAAEAENELRLVEATRRARGLVARLRAAWRSE